MGRCRRCGCTEYDCGFVQFCANVLEKTVDIVVKANGHNPQPNQNVAFRKCTCGHHKYYHD